ncbi:hypothetical protein ACFU99_40390, partial [Streptomyces sp. NPDC057654]
MSQAQGSHRAAYRGAEAPARRAEPHLPRQSPRPAAYEPHEPYGNLYPGPYDNPPPGPYDSPCSGPFEPAAAEPALPEP